MAFIYRGHGAGFQLLISWGAPQADIERIALKTVRFFDVQNSLFGIRYSLFEESNISSLLFRPTRFNIRKNSHRKRGPMPA
jgi:hypothetical protein